MLSGVSSDNASADFLLSLIFVGDVFCTAVWAKSDETEDKTTAMVCVIVPGFISKQISVTQSAQAEKQRGLNFRWFTTTQKSVSRGKVRVRRKPRDVTSLQTESCQ